MWIIWRLIYAFSHPRDVDDLLLRARRMRNPWRRWRPGVIRSEHGGQWHVYLSAERDYTVPDGNQRVTLHYSETTGEVVGFTIFDEELAILLWYRVCF